MISDRSWIIQSVPDTCDLEKKIYGVPSLLTFIYKNSSVNLKKKKIKKGREGITGFILQVYAQCFHLLWCNALDRIVMEKRLIFMLPNLQMLNK